MALKIGELIVQISSGVANGFRIRVVSELRFQLIELRARGFELIDGIRHRVQFVLEMLDEFRLRLNVGIRASRVRVF